MAQTEPVTTAGGDRDNGFVLLSGAQRPLTARQIGVVSGIDVAVFRLTLPKGLRGQSREQVAQRQLRDEMGIDAEAVDIRPIYLPGGADDWNTVLVADRMAVARWREHAGDKCRAVLPDYLTLPTADGVWSIAQNAQGVAVRLGPVDGFGAGLALGPVLLRRALAEADPSPRLILYIGEQSPEIEAIVAEAGITVVADADEAGATTLAHGELAFDLRRDPQLARARLSKRVLPWRWPLIAGLAAAFIWAAAETVVINRLSAQTTQLRQQTRAMVQEHFVKTGPVLDARVQVSQVLAQAKAAASDQGTGPDPLDLFARAAAVIAEQRAVTEMASFAQNDGLSMVVRVADFAGAEQLAIQMRAAGMQVTVGDTRASDTDNGVRSTLRLRPDTTEEQSE